MLPSNLVYAAGVVSLTTLLYNAVRMVVVLCVSFAVPSLSMLDW